MLRIREYLILSIKNIVSNRMRSILTILGILIGISSVIVIITIGDGLSDKIKGINDSEEFVLLTQGSMAIANNDFLDKTDINSIEKIDGVEKVSPYFSETGTTKIENVDKEINIIASDDNIVKKIIGNSNYLSKGRIFNNNDVQIASNVCVLFKQDAMNIFHTDNVIGEKITVSIMGEYNEYEIIGIVDSINDNNVDEQENDEYSCIYVPYTALNKYKYEQFSSLYAVLESGVNTKKITKTIKNIILIRHNTFQDDYFIVQSNTELFDMLGDVLHYIAIFISIVAGISLVVGSVGIMNIMLVSVVERVREIGIRKSVGAKMSNITLQFLIESSVLSFVGGLLGIIFGILISYLTCKLIGFNYIFNYKVVLLSLVISVFIGIVSGVYPASKASRLNPVDALRHD